MDRNEILGNNRIEDVRWLCSLSESELDLLISLKLLVLQRAKIIGHDDLAKKFDLKMLRALGFILMEHLKGQFKEMPVAPDSTTPCAILDGCNLLKHNLNNDFSNMGIEELKSYIGSDRRKRIAEMFLEDMSPNRKKKTDSGTSLKRKNCFASHLCERGMLTWCTLPQSCWLSHTRCATSSQLARGVVHLEVFVRGKNMGCSVPGSLNNFSTYVSHSLTKKLDSAWVLGWANLDLLN